MYDGYICCNEYKNLKDNIVDIINGDVVDYDLERLSNHIQDNHIQESYDNGEMQTTQYDDLMRYIEDL